MLRRRTENAQSTIQGNRNYSGAERGRRWPPGQGDLPRVRDIGRDLLQLENEVPGGHKYGGMEIADIRKLKELADENRRLKQMYADLSLKHEALRDIVEKKL